MFSWSPDITNIVIATEAESKNRRPASVTTDQVLNVEVTPERSGVEADRIAILPTPVIHKVTCFRAW